MKSHRARDYGFVASLYLSGAALAAALLGGIAYVAQSISISTGGQ